MITWEQSLLLPLVPLAYEQRGFTVVQMKENRALRNFVRQHLEQFEFWNNHKAWVFVLRGGCRVDETTYRKLLTI